MRRTMLGGAVLALVTAVGTLTAAPASADVRGDLRMVGERPVSGTFDLKYNNYREKIRRCRPHVCTFLGYRVARGKMEVKLHTYKVVERMRRFDYYVLDVDVANTGRYGSSSDGWAKVHVAKADGIKWVDYGDTSSISAEERDCVDLGLSMGGSIGAGGASVSWGSVRFCSKAARYSIQSRTGKTTTYLAMDTRNISRYSSQRLVKVKRGKKPKFKVTVHVPRDKCTASENGKCTAYDNGSKLFSYKIRTDG